MHSPPPTFLQLRNPNAATPKKVTGINFRTITQISTISARNQSIALLSVLLTDMTCANAISDITTGAQLCLGPGSSTEMVHSEFMLN